MAKKQNKAAAPANTENPVVENEAVITEPAAAEPVPAPDAAAAVSSGAEQQLSDSDDVAGRTRKRAGPLDRLSEAIEILKQLQQPNATTNARSATSKLNRAVNTLERVQEALSSAKITLSKKSRTPNDYNQFVSAQMQSLKDSDLSSTEKFRRCIQLWNEQKASQQATALPAAVEAC